MYIVLNLYLWDSLGIKDPKQIGYVPVFDNYENALRCANYDFTLVREVELVNDKEVSKPNI